MNITTGAQVADRLYGTATPVVTLSQEDFAQLATGSEATVTDEDVVVAESVSD